MLNLPNPSRWGRESESYLGSGVLCCLSGLGMIEQHQLWGLSLRRGVSLALELTLRWKLLGGFSSLRTPSTILSRLLGVVWALSVLETCRALLKGVSYFRVVGGEGVLLAPSYKGLQCCKVPPTLCPG